MKKAENYREYETIKAELLGLALGEQKDADTLFNEIRELAIDYQYVASEIDLSYGEIAEFNELLKEALNCLSGLNYNLAGELETELMENGVL